MGADHEGSEITTSQWLKDRADERYATYAEKHNRRIREIGWSNITEIAKRTGMLEGKDAQSAREIKVRFSAAVLTVLGVLRDGYGKDNRGHDGRARLSAYKDAVKTLQLVYPPYPSDDQPSSKAAADILPTEKALDVEEANTWLMAAMPADEGWEYSEFRTLLPLLLKRIEKAEQYAQRDYEKQEKEKGGRPEGHEAGIAVDTFVYDFCRGVLLCGGKFAHSRKGAKSPRYVGTLIEHLRGGLPDKFPPASEIERKIETKGKEAMKHWKSMTHQ